MTKERKEEVVLIALVVSLVLHAGIMVYVRPRAMASIADGVVRAVCRGPMRVTKNIPVPDPVRIAALPDAAPARDAPAVTQAGIPLVGEMGIVTSAAAERSVPSLPPAAVAPVERPTFDARPIQLDSVVTSARIPMLSIETPGADSIVAATSPDVLRLPLVAAAPVDVSLPAIGKDRESMFLPSGVASVTVKPLPTLEVPPAPEFKPTDEVYSKVDEKVVEQEKTAVKTLVESVEAKPLEPLVGVAMQKQQIGDWTYFKVVITPRNTLEVVPKDIVLLLDASGSIGRDRIKSIRNAAKRILRSATNSGDRFNLVAFRNRFTYAFRVWQECNSTSFDIADRWLGNLVAHGRTDVFSTISSVLTLPRTPSRPLVALVVTDGDANVGVSDTAEILSRFTKLNDGLISVYMYGVRSSANRELIDVLTHGNRGESFIFDGWRWNAGEGIEPLSERFRDPVMSDLRIVFASSTPAEAYPRVLRNIYRGGTVSFVGRVPAGTADIAFSVQGLSIDRAYEGFFKLPLSAASGAPGICEEWQSEQSIDRKLNAR